ncbi:MAG: isoprenylcysteine carboxylmethyltransferase family protein [Planctomycetota bacterium]
MSEPVLGWAVIALFALHRLLELPFARANARRLVAAGARTVRADGLLALVAVHVAVVAGVALERGLGGARMPGGAGVAALVALVPVEALRVWTLATLGRRWTVRVVVVPDETPVRAGPYRWLRHPNYVVVALEVVLVPFAVGAWRTALAAALPTLLALRHRVRLEEAAWRAVAATPLGPDVSRGAAS